jgi:hypothetical protein
MCTKVVMLLLWSEEVCPSRVVVWATGRALSLLLSLVRRRMSDPCSLFLLLGRELRLGLGIWACVQALVSTGVQMRRFQVCSVRVVETVLDVVFNEVHERAGDI